MNLKSHTASKTLEHTEMACLLSGMLGKKTLGKETLGKKTLGKETLGKETSGKETSAKETLSLQGERFINKNY